MKIQEYVRNWRELREKQLGKSDEEAKAIADAWLADWQTQHE